MVKTANNSEEKMVTTANSSPKRRRGGKVGRTMRAHGKKDTFWNKIRVKSNITYKEIAEYLKCGKSTVTSFFTGSHVPKDEYIDKLCELFGVDRILGEREFRKANREWDTIHDGKDHPTFSAEVKKETKPKAKPETKVVEKRSVIIKHEEEKSTMDISGLHRAAFDVMDYDDFVTFTKLLGSCKTYETENDWKNEVNEFIGSRIYGKVSRAQYDKINRFFI